MRNRRATVVFLVGILGATGLFVALPPAADALVISPGIYGVGSTVNPRGVIGDGDPTNFGDDEPVGPISLGSSSPPVAVAAGGSHSLALLADGTVLSFGENSFGALGRPAGTTSTPGVVTGLGAGSGVIAIAAGGSHSLALRSDGSVLTWGSNDKGQLGDGTLTNRGSPVSVSGLGSGSGVVSIAAGMEHSLAARADGSVVAWGANVKGQVGDSTGVNRTTPTDAAGLGVGSGIVEVAAGLYHSLALADTGAVFSWGAWGGIGDGAMVNRFSPVPVSGLGAGSGVVTLDGGSNYSAALRNDGTLLTWGDTSYGRRCNGEDPRYTSPIEELVQTKPEVLAGVSSVVAFSLGFQHTAFVTSDGTLWGCGLDLEGQLGIDARPPTGPSLPYLTPTPAHVLTAGSGTFAVAAGMSHTLAISTGGETSDTTAAPPTTSAPSSTTLPTTTTTVPSQSDLPAVSIGDVDIQQGDADKRVANVTLTLDKPSAIPVFVTVRSRPDATNNGAYSALTKAVKFAARATVKTVPISVFGSTTNNDDKHAILDIIGAQNATIDKGSGTVTIESDPATAAVDVSVADVTVVEGDAGANKANFTVSLNRKSLAPVTVTYRMRGSDATSTDFKTKAGTLTFKPGIVSKPLVVSILADNVDENDETFVLELTSATGAALDESTGIGTIRDND